MGSAHSSSPEQSKAKREREGGRGREREGEGGRGREREGEGGRGREREGARDGERQRVLANTSFHKSHTLPNGPQKCPGGLTCPLCILHGRRRGGGAPYAFCMGEDEGAV